MSKEIKRLEEYEWLKDNCGDRLNICELLDGCDHKTAIEKLNDISSNIGDFFFIYTIEKYDDYYTLNIGTMKKENDESYNERKLLHAESEKIRIDIAEYQKTLDELDSKKEFNKYYIKDSQGKVLNYKDALHGKLEDVVKFLRTLKNEFGDNLSIELDFFHESVRVEKTDLIMSQEEVCKNEIHKKELKDKLELSWQKLRQIQERIENLESKFYKGE